MNRTRDLAGRTLLGQSLPFAGRDAVELGCGTGRNTEWLAAEARTVTALDFSEGMLREARRRATAPTVRFHEHDVRESWPLADASADLVVVELREWRDDAADRADPPRLISVRFTRP